MNIGIFSVHPQSESMGTNSRIKGLCKGLSALGHSALVFTPYEFRGDWGKNTTFHQIASLTGNSGIATFIYKYARRFLNMPFISKRLILRKKTLETLISRMASGFLNYLKRNPTLHLDAILGESEIASLALCRIKREIGVPVIAEFNNFWPEELITNHLLKRDSTQHHYLLELEREIISTADHITTATDFLKQYLIQEFKAKSTQITPLYHGGGFLPIQNSPKTIPPRVIFAGLVQTRANLQLFLEAIPLIRKEIPEATFYITRKGEDLPKIQKLAKRSHLPVNFYWFEDYNEFVQFLPTCSVGILTSSEDLPAKFGPASKMFDYFAAGVPVVGNDIGSWTTELREKQVALICAGNPQSLGKATISILKDPNLGEFYAQRGRELVENEYNWVNLVNEKLIPLIPSKSNI